MAFQTSPGANSRDQPPVSLLFTPAMKSAEGKVHSPALGRAQSLATPGFGGPAFGLSPGLAGTRDAATPPSRRRSMTPASSAAKDTPPPPPVDSIMDSPGLATWGARSGTGAGGVEDMATSPSGAVGTAPFGAIPQPTSTAAAGGVSASAPARDFAAAGRALRDYESTWVTVFGFSQADVPLILREFGRCGDVVRYGTFGDGPQVNWLHIRYANKHAAQRALLRSGDPLSTSCMVGVKPVDPSKADALERAAAGQGGTTTVSSAGPALPKPARARSYHVNATATQAAVVPLASKSAWQKVSEFILGL